jgi:hypothetical protein
MRIRPLHVIGVLLAVGATYAAVSVVASLAQIKAVGERASAAAEAGAERARAADAVIATQRERAARESAADRPGSVEPEPEPEQDQFQPSRRAEPEVEAAPLPGVAEGEDVDSEAREAEERYINNRFPEDEAPGDADEEFDADRPFDSDQGLEPPVFEDEEGDPAIAIPDEPQ